MIMYNFGNIECKIDFNNFLSIDDINGRLYKKDFKTFYDFYEYLEFNLYDITHILFDGYEYYLQNGKLHNLYGPAHIRYNVQVDHLINNINIHRFFIKGKLVFDDITKCCSKIENFNSKELFFYEDITKKVSGYDRITGKCIRRKEGVDYTKTIINLEHLRKLDNRRKKLIEINVRTKNI